MKVLIIEDEQPAARRLKRLIQDAMPSAEILSVIDSVRDAVEYLENDSSAQLIFMDIQLADGLSFDIFSKCTVTAPVIFTTAFDHYAVKAFKVNSIDYLLKPIDPSELVSAINKWKSIYDQRTPAQVDYNALAKAIALQSEPYKKRFLVKSAGKLNHINTEDIAHFFSDEGLTFLVTTSADRFLIDGSLDDLEPLLDPKNYFRINRKMIVALASIRKIEPHFNHRFLLELHPPFSGEILVSRQRASQFRDWLDS